MCVCVCAELMYVFLSVVIDLWHCSAQLSMFNMEKLYRNKIILLLLLIINTIY